MLTNQCPRISPDNQKLEYLLSQTSIAATQGLTLICTEANITDKVTVQSGNLEAHS